jgi:hypothetical protein
MEARLKLGGIPTSRLAPNKTPAVAAVQLGTMHRAKGLEFKVVFVIDVSHDVLPSSPSPEESADEPARRDAEERDPALKYRSDNTKPAFAGWRIRSAPQAHGWRAAPGVGE